MSIGRGAIFFSIALFLTGCGSLLPVEQAATGAQTASPLAATTQEAITETAVNEPAVPEPEPVELNLIERIISQFDWPDESHQPRVQTWIERYRQDPQSFHIILQRSEPFLYAAADQLKTNKLPAELAFLPFVESGFRPNVRSWTGAEGLWQFMPATAQHMGLQRDWWVDERRDPLRSTEAAAAYLKYLHQVFDDWYLALAAYNTGEGNIRFAMQRADSDRFWDLKLNSETASYLPKLLAVIHLLKNPDQLGLKLPDWPDQPYFNSVELDRQVKLQDVADYLGAGQDFYQLNAHFVQRISHPESTSNLLVPARLDTKLRAGLSDETLIPDVYWQHYQVRNGDNLSLIADRMDVSVRAIMEINRLDSTLIHPGDDLLIPRDNLAVSHSPSVENTEYQIMVLPGDSIWAISLRTGASMRSIMQLNELDERSVLQPGDQLKLPASASIPDQVEHLVRSGDSLSEIALRYGVTIEEIRTWNALGNSSLIRAGDRLTLWLDGASS